MTTNEPSTTHHIVPPSDTQVSAFISYSRHDQEFVRRLRERLSDNQVHIWVDWTSIPLSATWWDEITQGIEGTDAFIFIISPASIESAACRAEIEHAVKNNKKIIPIVREEIEFRTAPAAIAERQALFMRDDDDFSTAFTDLMTTLHTDLELTKEHTALLQRAKEWESHTRNHSFLLRGSALTQSETWLDRCAEHLNPTPSQLQTEYILASRRASGNRLRFLSFITLVGLGIVSILAIIALLNSAEASRQRAQAVQERDIAVARRLAAEAEATRSEPGTSLRLSTLLAVESLKRLPSFDAAETLRRNLSLLPYREHIFAHGGPVEQAAFSPDGKFIATVADDAYVRVWDRESGHLIMRRRDFGFGNSVAFSPNGKYLVATDSGVGPSYVHVWEVGEKWKHVINLGNSNFPIFSPLTFSPDGRYVAASTVTGIVLWNIQSHWKRSVIGVYTSGVPPGAIINAIAFTPNSRTMVTSIIAPGEGPFPQYAATMAFDGGKKWRRTGFLAGVFLGNRNQVLASNGRILLTTSLRRGGVNLYGMQQGYRLLHRIKFGSTAAAASAISADGQHIALTLRTAVVILDRSPHWHVSINTDTASQCGQVLFSRDSHHLAVGCFDGTVRIWRWNDGWRQTARLAHEAPANVNNYSATGNVYHSSAITSVSWSQSSTTVLSSSVDHTARLWDVAHPWQPVATSLNTGPSQALSFGRDGQSLVATSPEGNIGIWNIAHDERTAYIAAPNLLDTVFDSIAGRLSNLAAEERFRIWSARVNWTGEAAIRSSLLPNARSVSAVAYGANYRYVAASNNRDYSVNVWLARNGNPISSFHHSSHYNDNIWALAFSPNGKTIATVGNDKTVRMWETLSGKLLFTKYNVSAFDAIAFSPDGRYLAAVGEDYAAYIWASNSGTLVARLPHEAPLTTISYSKDGHYIATAGFDNVVHIWDIGGNSQEVTRLQMSASVTAIEFTPKDTYVAVSSVDGFTRLWKWEPSDLEQAACSRIDRNLTTLEWEQYVGSGTVARTCSNLPASK